MIVIYTLIGVISGSVGGCEGFQWQPLPDVFFYAGCNSGSWFAILVTGVKMSMAELLHAFKGFASKIVPGAVPSVDIPFLSVTTTGSLLVSVHSGRHGNRYLNRIVSRLSYITIRSVLPIFFGGIIIGVMADARSGWRGVLLSCFHPGNYLYSWFSCLCSGDKYAIGSCRKIDYVLVWLPLFAGLRLFFGS